jgi:hypothetical protein
MNLSIWAAREAVLAEYHEPAWVAGLTDMSKDWHYKFLWG